jgi:hypothetical protein
VAGLARAVPGVRGRDRRDRGDPGSRAAGHGRAAPPPVRGAAGRVGAAAAHRAGAAPVRVLPGHGIRGVLGGVDGRGAAADRAGLPPRRLGRRGAGPGQRGDHGVHPGLRPAGRPVRPGPGQPGHHARHAGRRGRAPARRPRRGGGPGRAGGRHAAAGRGHAVRHDRQPGADLRAAARCPQPAQQRVHDVRVRRGSGGLLARRGRLRAGRLAGRGPGRRGADRAGAGPAPAPPRAGREGPGQRVTRGAAPRPCRPRRRPG